MSIERPQRALETTRPWVTGATFVALDKQRRVTCYCGYPTLLSGEQGIQRDKMATFTHPTQPTTLLSTRASHLSFFPQGHWNCGWQTRTPFSSTGPFIPRRTVLT